MTCDKAGRVRCNACGKYTKYDYDHTTYIPDSPFTSELIEHFCAPCYQRIYGKGAAA